MIRNLSHATDSAEQDRQNSDLIDVNLCYRSHAEHIAYPVRTRSQSDPHEQHQTIVCSEQQSCMSQKQNVKKNSANYKELARVHISANRFRSNFKLICLTIVEL